MPHLICPDFSHPVRRSYYFFRLLVRDPTVYPQPFRFKEFIPAARKPASLQRIIHITYAHSLEHSCYCKEQYCPYHR